jgi:phosphate-selective porin OprO and OprP
MLSRFHWCLNKGIILLVTGWLSVHCVVAWSQSAAIQSPPAPTAKAAPVVTLEPESTEPIRMADLINRLRASEAANRELSQRVEQLSEEQEQWRAQLQRQIDEYPESDGRQAAGRQARDDPREASISDREDFDPGISEIYSGQANSYREGYDPSIPDYFDLDLDSPYSIPQRLVFGPGFQLQSEDESFRLQIHYESQIENRLWSPEDQLPANSGFFLPRQRFFFAGNITKMTDYELAINRGVNNINLLNAFINFRFNERFMLRIGRFFTPLFYDQYAISNYWLLTPERSLFTTNLSLNRQIGAMAWGYLLDKRLDYAAGLFNGSRNSFESLDDAGDFVGYLNARPFQNSQLTMAENWNVGTSVAFGRQEQSPVPRSFRVGAGSPDANIPGIATVPFLVLNPTVVEQGDRLVGSVHMAYFFRSLTAIGEWQYGYGNYSPTAGAGSVKVPFSGYYLKLGYFLTGEQIDRRTRLRPLRPFAPIDPEASRGPGAWEVVSRVSQIQLGDQIFDSGLADQSLWSNEATTAEVGLNWYLNDYMKFYFCWLHASFDSPVQYRPGNFQNSADMFWMRCQLYF